jgi:hypothetical protein
LLVAGILKSTCHLKGFVNLHECFFAVFDFSGIQVNLGLGISEHINELGRILVLEECEIC